jgi:hypothetical protein
MWAVMINCEFSLPHLICPHYAGGGAVYKTRKRETEREQEI